MLELSGPSVYLTGRRALFMDMNSHRDARRAWRTLTAAEKQLRLERLRRHQQQQLARDARALRLTRG